MKIFSLRFLSDGHKINANPVRLFALESIDNNELACGEKMTKTTMNYYLLDYKDNNQIQKYFQESNKDIEYGEDKVFEETKHNINN